MNYREFLEYHLEDGFYKMTDAIKMLVYKSDQNLFNLLDFEDLYTFSEPLLFAYFNCLEAPKSTLVQIVFGYISEDKKPDTIEVYVDSKGRTYLPTIGTLYFPNGLSGQFISIRYNEGNFLWQDNVLEIKPDYYLKEVGFTNLFVYATIPALLVQVIPEIESSDFDFNSHLQMLIEAMPMIEKANPWYAGILKTTPRALLIYNNRDQYSFATMKACGIGFLNASYAEGEIFYIEDVIHQLGHVLFYSISYDKAAFFTVDADETSIYEFTNIESDRDRMLYGSYHGIFTLAVINNSLDKLLDCNIYDGERKFEILGRFARDMDSFCVSLERLSYMGWYTEQGAFLYKKFKEIYDELISKRWDYIQNFDFSNQDYIFEYSLFKELNSHNKIIGDVENL